MSPLEFFITFLKASLFSTGGFGNLPSLHQDLIASNLATDADFGQSIAVGQISPGPNGLWVIALGYFTYGFLGAILALFAIIIPALIVLIMAALYNRIAHLTAVEGIARGISLGVVGLFVIVVISLLSGPGADWRGLLFFGGAFALSLSKKINVVIILTLAALGGYLIYN